MSRRWTPALATTTVLALLATTGGMAPGTAETGGRPERATTYLPPQDHAADDRSDAVVGTDGRNERTRGAAERSRVRLAQSSSRQDVLRLYAGEVPSYVHAGPLTVAGLAFDHPVAGPFTLSSAFGWRLNPTDVGPAVQFHIGLDYAVDCGTPVRAAADGTVVSAGERGTGGLRVDIDHGDGIVTSYRHNSQLLVSPGDPVSRGDVISLSGTTGNSTGCHLHFDATLDGQYVDPAQLLPAVSGMPRPLDAEDLERIRAAAQQAAADVPQDRTDAASRTERTTTDPGPVARPAAPRAEAFDVGAGDQRAPSSRASAQPSQSPAPTQPLTSPRPSPDQAEPSEPATPEKPAQDEPTPKPTEPAAQQPKPTASGTPAAEEPATPEPTESATPEPTEPTESATPEPTGPVEPVTPSVPEALTEEEAAQWCLPLADDAEGSTPDFSELFTGDYAALVGLIAALDEDSVPQYMTEETLLEVSPSALWLESLPACSDAEFVEAALAARSAG